MYASNSQCVQLNTPGGSALDSLEQAHRQLLQLDELESASLESTPRSGNESNGSEAIRKSCDWPWSLAGRLTSPVSGSRHKA